MRIESDPQKLVPPGALLIAVRVNHKTGRAAHSLLMHEDVDPALLEAILKNANTMEIRRRKFTKLRLPPQKTGDPVRSFPHRIIVREDSATTNLGPGMARMLVSDVVAQLLQQTAASLPAALAAQAQDPLGPR
ncbi:MAG TPA: hypothetical protein VIY27_08270 [Myxococcota bacterium]